MLPTTLRNVKTLLPREIQALPAKERSQHLRADLKFTKDLSKSEQKERAALDRQHNTKTLFSNIRNVFKFFVGAAPTLGQASYAHAERAATREVYGVAGTYAGYQAQIKAEAAGTTYTGKMSAKD